MTTQVQNLPAALHEDDDLLERFDETPSEAFVLSGPLPTLAPDLIECSMPARGCGLCD